MSESRGRVIGASAEARAIALAGALAELGVGRLLMRAGGVETELAARTCDLPGLLMRAGRATLEVAQPPMRFEITPERIEWRARDAVALRRVLGAPEQAGA